MTAGRRRWGRQWRRQWKTLAASLVLAIGVSGCGFSLQSFPKIGSQHGPSYPLRARFTNVLNLPADAQVREGAAVVGQVSSISTHNFLADLTLAIRRGIRIPVGTTAEVRFDSPLGDEYVLLTPPANQAKGWLASDAVIPATATSTAPSVEDVLTVLGTVLNGGGISQLHTIVSQLNDALDGNQSQIRDLLGQLATTLGSLAAHTPDIASAISAVGSLAAQLNAGAGVITRGIVVLAPATRVLASENSDLHALLVQLTNLSRTANRIVAASGDDSVNDAHQLLPVVNQLVGVESKLGPDLTDIARFEAETPKIAPGDYLQVAVNLNAEFAPGPADADAPSGSSAVTALLENGLP